MTGSHYSQGLYILLIDKEKIKMLRQMKIKQVHFAGDRYQDKKEIVPKFKEFKELTGWGKRKQYTIPSRILNE